MFMFNVMDRLSEEKKEEIRQKFTLLLLDIAISNGEISEDTHPVDFASYVLFLCMTVWRTHADDKGFYMLVHKLQGNSFIDFPDFWETVMDDPKAVEEARSKTDKLDVISLLTRKKEDIN